MTKKELAKLKKYSTQQIIDRMIELQAEINSLNGPDAESKDPSSIKRTQLEVERYKLEQVLLTYKIKQVKAKKKAEPKKDKTKDDKPKETKPKEVKPKKEKSGGTSPTKPKVEKAKKEKAKDETPSVPPYVPLGMDWSADFPNETESPAETAPENRKSESDSKVVYLGSIRAFLLRIIRKIRSIVEKGAFLDNALGGLERGLLKGAKPAALNPAKEKMRSNSVNLVKDDIIWFAEKMKTSNSLANKLFKEEFEKTKSSLKDLTEREKEEKLNKMIKEQNIPEISSRESLSKIENKILDVSMYNAVKLMYSKAEQKGIKLKSFSGKTREISTIYKELDILEKAEKEGIRIKDDKGKNRPFDDISKEYEEKIELRRKALDVALFGVAGDSERNEHEDREI